MFLIIRYLSIESDTCLLISSDIHQKLKIIVPFDPYITRGLARLGARAGAMPMPPTSTLLYGVTPEKNLNMIEKNIGRFDRAVILVYLYNKVSPRSQRNIIQ